MDRGISNAVHFLQQENSRLKEQLEILQDENSALKSYLQDLSAVYQATKTIISHDDLFKLLDEILYQALVIIKTAHGSLLLVDDETDELVFVMVHGEFRETLQNYRMSIDQGIAGWVARHGEPIIVNDANLDPRFYADVDHTFGLTTQKLLAVPLIDRNHTLGVIELVNKQDGSDFTESDATILSLLGIIAAMALHRMDEELDAQENPAEEDSGH